jgi:adenylate cyclase
MGENDSNGQRRLAAIAFTDIVGYTSFAQRDESLALRILEEHNALVRSVLRQHRGAREVKTIGDAFLLEFDSALEAVSCAIDIQAAFRDRNKQAREGERILLRIGVHEGDIVHRDGDIFGDAVNVASRVVKVSGAGGVSVSDSVYGAVRNKIQYPIVKMPDARLRNVDQELSLFKIVLPWEQELVDASDQIAAPKNRIAIIPFSNISPNAGDEYFADGLTEELISALSEIGGLRIIARTSVNRYRGTTKRVREIARELEVAYVMEGSVRKSGDRIRVSAQLIDGTSEEHVWSNQYDRNLGDVFAIQSDIARNVADSLRVTVLSGEKARIEKPDTENLDAYVAYLKGRALLHERTEDVIKKAREQFELAVKEDPNYARAYAGLADTFMLLADYLFAPIPESLDEARRYINKALELDPNIGEAHVSLAYSLLYAYRFHDAEKEFRRGIALNPSYATAHHWYRSCLEILGRSEEALAEVTLAEELDPLSPAISMSAMYTCLDLRKDEEALKRIRKISRLDPQSPLIDEGYMAYHFAREEWDDALRYLSKMQGRDPTDPFLDADEGFIRARRGERNEAMRIIEEKLMKVPDELRVKNTLIAFVYAGFGDLDSCFVWLEKAFDVMEPMPGWFRTYPLVENVRKDPRYWALLKKVHLE